MNFQTLMSKLNLATATVATHATDRRETLPSVAKVASVAVAGDQMKENEKQSIQPQQSFFALPCRDKDKTLLADAVVAIDELKQAGRVAESEELERAVNTLDFAEGKADQESFDFAFIVLRTLVEERRNAVNPYYCL